MSDVEIFPDASELVRAEAERFVTVGGRSHPDAWPMSRRTFRRLDATTAL